MFQKMLLILYKVYKSINQFKYTVRSLYTVQTVHPSCYLQVELRGALDEDSFPLSFTGYGMALKLSTLHSPPKKDSLAGLL